MFLRNGKISEKNIYIYIYKPERNDNSKIIFFFVDSSLFDTQNDVSKSEPEEIWLQLMNNIIIPH
jgi:hypothetical protein